MEHNVDLFQSWDRENKMDSDSGDEESYGKANRTQEESETRSRLFGESIDLSSYDNQTHASSFVSWFYSITFKVYCSRSLSAWGDRMWDFATALFLVHLSPDSLQLIAIYGFVTRSSILVLGAMIGEWIDRVPRLKAARVSLIIQNAAVMLCASVILILIYLAEAINQVWGLEFCGRMFVILLATIASLASVGNGLCLERDWIIVIAENDKQKLSVMNAAMRRIYLTTATLAPVAIGQMMTFASVEIACIVVAAWNFFSVFIEYFLLLKIHKAVPALAIKKINGTDLDGYCSAKQSVMKKSCFYYIISKLTILKNGWWLYWSQDTFLAGIALACLYMTVLGFDSITIAYAYSQGLSEAIVSASFAIGSVIGISGTYAFPYFYKRIGLERTGIIAFFLEIIWLSLCVGSIWAQGSPFNYNSQRISTNSTSTTQSSTDLLQNTSIILFMIGILLARFGLWLADLSVTQTFQENVQECERGVVSGVQSSLNMLMDMLKFGMVILAPEPKIFGMHIIISFLFICIGYTSYIIHCHKT